MINYEKFLIKDKKEVYCIKCGDIAKYELHGYTWCEKHKEYLKKDPEELEKIVIERLFGEEI